MTSLHEQGEKIINVHLMNVLNLTHFHGSGTSQDTGAFESRDGPNKIHRVLDQCMPRSTVARWHTGWTLGLAPPGPLDIKKSAEDISGRLQMNQIANLCNINYYIINNKLKLIFAEIAVLFIIFLLFHMSRRVTGSKQRFQPNQQEF